MNEDKIIYILDDKICFRKCSLFDKPSTIRGDCTNSYTQEQKWIEYYHCHQQGIHFHCKKHPSIELDEVVEYPFTLRCPKCNEELRYENKNELINKCLKTINCELFKNAKLVRVEDYYYPELKIKDILDKDSDYFMTADVKKDKDGDTIVVLYLGHKGSKEKTQFFIKPEKLQLSSDHKDLDPEKILAKIEVVFKDRTLLQIYDDQI